MTATRIGVGFGIGLLALTASAGTYALAQNTNADPRPFIGRGLGSGGPMGPGRRGPGGPGTGGPMGPEGPLGMLRMMGPRLGLTDAQKDQIKNLAETRRDEWKGLADRARAAHEALHDVITAETVDEALIRQRSAEVAAIEADLAVARARTHAEVWQILTPEQKAQAQAFQAEAKNRMKERAGGRRGGGRF